MYQWSLSHYWYWCQCGVAAAGILRPGAGRPGWGGVRGYQVDRTQLGVLKIIKP